MTDDFNFVDCPGIFELLACMGGFGLVGVKNDYPDETCDKINVKNEIFWQIDRS